jgi:hypothetical protein
MPSHGLGERTIATCCAPALMRPLINQEFRSGSIRHVIGSEACGRRPMTLAARHFPGCPLILKRLLGSALG